MKLLITHWLLILTSTLLFILCDTLAANWSKNNNNLSIVALAFLAPVGYIFFGLINKDRTLATSSGIVNMGLLIGTVLMSIFFFREGMTSSQMVGLIFAILAVYFLA